MTSVKAEDENKRVPRACLAVLHKHWWIVLLAICLMFIGVYVFLGGEQRSYASRQEPKNGAQSTSVVVVSARKADIGVYLTGLGTVTPLNTVTVKSRVDGQLMEVLFKEGQMVRRGDPLAVIDPRPFQVQLTQAEGQMARDQQILENARLDLERYQVLWRQDSISKQQVDTQGSLVRQYEGVVKADQGQIDSARLQLLYSRITAPISGRVGLRLVDPGNIVHASDANGLVIITQLQPIAVIFPIPEDSLPAVLDKLRRHVRLTVDAYDREQKHKLAAGYLLTVDNQIDPNTGTVKFKALFPNNDNALFPNQFVNARLLVEVRRGVIVVPSVAIQRGSKGAFVYVVRADHTVEMRPVSIGITEGDEVSLTTGLASGELVVVEGSERLREGSRVEFRGKNGNDPKGRS